MLIRNLSTNAPGKAAIANARITPVSETALIVSMIVPSPAITRSAAMVNISGRRNKFDKLTFGYPLI